MTQPGKAFTSDKIHQAAQPGIQPAMVKILRIICLVQMCVSNNYSNSLLIKKYRQQHRARPIDRQIRAMEKTPVYKALLCNEEDQYFPQPSAYCNGISDKVVQQKISSQSFFIHMHSLLLFRKKYTCQLQCCKKDINHFLKFVCRKSLPIVARKRFKLLQVYKFLSGKL